ncbi:hypothetical protein CR513_37428, partial [Mucuna pruriens]
MVKSMINHSSLLESLWGEALKIVVYILKSIEAWPYRPHERKLDSSIVNCYFVGYAKCSRGCKFYDPTSRRNNILICSKVHLTFVSKDTLWVDSRATTHISVKKSDDERFIFVGDDNKVVVETIATFRLQLTTGFHLDLLNFNLKRKLKPSNLIIVMNTMVDMTDQGTMSRAFCPFSQRVLGKPNMNGVTLKNVVKSIINHSSLLESLWEEALKTIVYIFNRNGKKSSIKHLYIWGCLAKAQPYRPHERKLDSRIVNYYFFGYVECCRGCKFYDRTSISFFKRKMQDFLRKKEENIRNVDFEEESVNEIGQVLVPITVQETTPVIKDNVQTNNLVELPEGVKLIGCKWIFKIKKNSKGNIKRYKTRLVAKDFTKKEGIGYKETFSLVSSKDSFSAIITLVAHFDLELHQMDVNTAFLNGDNDKMIYMSMVCKVKKSIYGLKHASHQWHHKFYQVISSCGFQENVVDDCIYHKFSGNKYIFLLLYVDDILLASSDTGLLYETKIFLTKNFEMKDLGEAYFVLGIQILKYRSQDIPRLSQENYINKVLDRFDMKGGKSENTLIAKGDKFSLK